MRPERDHLEPITEAPQPGRNDRERDARRLPWSPLELFLLVAPASIALFGFFDLGGDAARRELGDLLVHLLAVFGG